MACLSLGLDARIDDLVCGQPKGVRNFFTGPEGSVAIDSEYVERWWQLDRKYVTL